MKVVLAIEEFYQISGGVERTVAKLANGLAERGHEVCLLTFELSGRGEPFYPVSRAVRRVDLGMTANIERRESRGRVALRRRLPAWLLAALRNLTAARRMATVRWREVPVLANAFAELRPDVVISFKTHLHRYTIPAGRKAGVPVVASEHNPPEVLYGYYLSAVDRFVTLRWLRRAAMIRVLLDEFVPGYPTPLRPVCRVVGNGVYVPERPALVGAESAKLILNVGRLDPQKGQAYLIHAFAQLAGNYPRWKLRIVGEGERRGELERLVRELELSDRVELPGETRDVWPEYAAASVFAMSSLFEGFGNVTAEAMAAGLPVVGFADCAGTNRLIRDGETGLLVASRDRVGSLASGLSRLLEEPAERERMGRNAREAMQAYSEDAAIDRWEAVLTEAADGSGRPCAV